MRSAERRVSSSHQATFYCFMRRGKKNIAANKKEYLPRTKRTKPNR